MPAYTVGIRGGHAGLARFHLKATSEQLGGAETSLECPCRFANRTPPISTASVAHCNRSPLLNRSKRCERDPEFLGELRRRGAAGRPLVDPAHERASWRELVGELGLA